MTAVREPESVWDYPRPPRVEPAERPVRVEVGGAVVARSERALRVLETSHPPTYYIPPAAVAPGMLTPSPHRTVCEYKGVAHYWNLEAGGRVVENAAWSYPSPAAGYEELRDHVAFYASKVDAAYVGEERVDPQAGGFYGGWVTSDVVGPFKGGPGTAGW